MNKVKIKFETTSENTPEEWRRYLLEGDVLLDEEAETLVVEVTDEQGEN